MQCIGRLCLLINNCRRFGLFNVTPIHLVFIWPLFYCDLSYQNAVEHRESNCVMIVLCCGTLASFLRSADRYSIHDAISSDKRNPRLNANGLIYGSPEEAADFVPVLDPVKNTATMIKHPYLDPKRPSTKENTMGPSVYRGDDPIWDSHTSIHNPIMDEKGQVWFSAKLRPDENPAFCKQGSDHPSAKVAPLATSGRQLSMYDPKTQKWSLIIPASAPTSSISATTPITRCGSARAARKAGLSAGSTPSSTSRPATR
jgi:hypothetical protein